MGKTPFSKCVTAMPHESFQGSLITIGGSTVTDMAQIAITPTDQNPIVIPPNSAKNADGEPQLEGVNGDGTFDIIDVEVLFVELHTS